MNLINEYIHKIIREFILYMLYLLIILIYFYISNVLEVFSRSFTPNNNSYRTIEHWHMFENT